MSLGKPVIKFVDMDDEMKHYCVHEAVRALETQTGEKLVAGFMKSSLEKKYKGIWHCITGRNFGGYVTHETGKYIYFYIGQKGFLIWSTPSA